MTADTTRAVLLARAGEARTRLESALDTAGAEIVLAADPTEIDPDQVKALQPSVVLVALEPAIEKALESYETLFADPALTVFFEEADVAAQREGWDAARWTRHLAAKLQGSNDVLPPGRETDDDLQPSPGPLPARVEPEELDTALFEVEATELASEVPRDHDYLAAHHSANPAEDGGSSTMFSNLSLVDDESATFATEPASVEETEQGAVVIEGGIGSPDAVRQLLAVLAEGFARPVLVRLQLDGGRYDRLAQQMAKASLMPVLLAEAGQAAEPGSVYFLAPGTGLGREQGRLQFVESSDPPAALYAHLPAQDSALVLLSGSDLALVDAVIEQGGQGAFVAAQPASDCYEPTAVAALVERGGNACELGPLAQLLIERWPTLSKMS